MGAFGYGGFKLYNDYYANQSGLQTEDGQIITRVQKDIKEKIKRNN